MRKIILLVLLLPVFYSAQTGDDEFVNPKELIHDIVVDLRYSSPDHSFLNLPDGDKRLPKFYTCNESLMTLSLANALKMAQDTLRNIRNHNGKEYPSGIGIKIWDGYRPRAVQYLLFDIFPNPAYVADPNTGSMHNRGGAVDVTLVDLATGEELLMPTLFDDFSIAASHSYMNLPQEAIANRTLLRTIMEDIAGLNTYGAEWWHYNLPGAGGFPLKDFQMK
jgi:D-alanyl-D-alanine dipeptidase